MSDTRPQGQPDEAMVDLLIKQVTEGLSPADQRPLAEMDSELATAQSREPERAAAGVPVAGSTGGEPLPAALSARIAQQAAELFAAAEHSALPSNVADLSEVRTAAAEKARVQPPVAPSPAPAPVRAVRFGGYGWLAAAAWLVVAIFGWGGSPPPLPPVAVVAPPPVAPPPPAQPAPPTAAEERAALLAK